MPFSVTSSINNEIIKVKSLKNEFSHKEKDKKQVLHKKQKYSVTFLKLIVRFLSALQHIFDNIKRPI